MAKEGDPNAQNPDGTPPDEGGDTSGGDGQKDFKKLYEQLAKTSQASYTGLQKTLGKIQKDYEDLKGTHSTVLEQFGELQKTHTTTQESLDALTKRLEVEIPELEGLRLFKQRTDLIHSKFPTLVTFEADGLLPTGKPEELETKFKAFQDKLGNLAKVADQQQREGGTPPPPPGGDGVPSSADEFLKQAIAASAAGKFDDFDKFFNEYLKAGGTKPPMAT